MGKNCSSTLYPFFSWLRKNRSEMAAEIAITPSQYNFTLLFLFFLLLFIVPCKPTKDYDEPKILVYGTTPNTLLSNDGSLPSLARRPVSPDPNLTNCASIKPFIGNRTIINCCPPVSHNIMDFKLPINPIVKVRPAAHSVNATYLENYKEAIRRMKALPPNDPRNFYQQANIHCTYCEGAYKQAGFPNLDFRIHYSWLFFPFHRWYIYFYERILASLIKDLDPNFAIPFWNWDSPVGMQIPACYHIDPTSPLYDSRRNPNHLPPVLINLEYDYGKKDQNTPETNLQIMYRTVVSTSKTPTLFFGGAYRAGDYKGFSGAGGGSVEMVLHGGVHEWTGPEPADKKANGEDMGTFYSAARDPIFYSHHANLDRLWTIWKTLGGKRKDITDSDWLESGFLFYDENKNLVRVKVKDCLDTTKLGYVYQDVDVPWLYVKPTPRRRSRFIGKIKEKIGVDVAHDAAGTFQENKFPLVLDSSVRTIVMRPRKTRSKKEKEEEEEVLVIEGIEFQRDLAVSFDVYINDEDDVQGGPTKTEFAGSFIHMPFKHKHKQNKMKTHLRLGITELLEDLDAEDYNAILVTLVPKSGQGHVTIGGIKLEFY
ncbi:hypothetical protein RIF29_41416 [Crotalaria pallida]|uniref:Tyrosinase copper-binding domain-containing protein n=1 Tax=Crotalaria pallida TaxID=3830 RepID=A0AAN9EB69_CROPI